MKVRLGLQELDDWVKDYFQKIAQEQQALVICLSGEVGAGKTTLTQSIARYFDIKEPITSPTFVIQKEYEIEQHAWVKKMIHIDAYRLDKKEDLEYLGWNEIILNPYNLIIIEWPEMVSGIYFPKSVINFNIEINDDYTRTITISKQP